MVLYINFTAFPRDVVYQHFGGNLLPCGSSVTVTTGLHDVTEERNLNN